MSRMLRRLALASLLFAATLGLPSCGPTDSEITCANFDDFLFTCTANCSPTWDCEYNYERLSLYRQDQLDACSDCLVANLNGGFCGDCSDFRFGIASCHDFMERLLGVACWF